MSNFIHRQVIEKIQQTRRSQHSQECKDPYFEHFFLIQFYSLNSTYSHIMKHVILTVYKESSSSLFQLFQLYLHDHCMHINFSSVFSKVQSPNFTFPYTQQLRQKLSQTFRISLFQTCKTTVCDFCFKICFNYSSICLYLYTTE